MSDTKILSESLNAENINAATVAAEAHQKAQAAQIELAMQTAMETFFSRGVQEKRFVDVGRIPFICDDLRGIHAVQSEMQKGQAVMTASQDKIINDLVWIKWLVMGGVGGVGALVIAFLVK